MSIVKINFKLLLLLFLLASISSNPVNAAEDASSSEKSMVESLNECIRILRDLQDRKSQFKSELETNPQLKKYFSQLKPDSDTNSGEIRLENPTHPKGHILVVGGSNYIGIETVKTFIKNGYHVTLLNRGQTKRGTFPNIPLITADRDDVDQLQALAQDKTPFDVIVDMSVNKPSQVSKILETLKGRAKRYILISSVSAYERFNTGDFKKPFTEDDTLMSCTAEQAESNDNTFFGNRKAEAERVALAHMKNTDPLVREVVVLRPSLVYGKNDYSERFAYWMWRAIRNKSFIMPDNGEDMMPMAYVSDVAEAILAASFSPKAPGKAYNISDSESLNLRNTIAMIGQQIGMDSLKNAVSIPSEKLVSAGVVPQLMIGGQVHVDNSRAKADLNYKTTPLKEAISKSIDDFLSRQTAPANDLAPGAEDKLIEENGK